MSHINTEKKQKAAMALRSLFVADSISMPVHWYYRVIDIYQAFPGGIQKLEDAPSSHPSSIMSLHSTKQGGRKAVNKKTQKNIIGDVILKGKRQYWGQSNMHYHQGMKAGDTTLNAYCVKTLMASINNNDGQYDCSHYLDLYIDMMTAETPQHNDTYAESYHRGFFANYIQGKEPMKCGASTHDTASIGGLVGIGPLAIHLFLNNKTLSSAQELCKKHLFTTHPDPYLGHICESYVALIHQLLHCDDVDLALNHLLQTLNSAVKFNAFQVDFDKIEDAYFVGGHYSSACYITDSWPSVLFLACKYHDDSVKAILTNANLGGDNVHRGAVLATIVGLIKQKKETVDQILAWYQSLRLHESIEGQIKKLLKV